MKKAKTIKEVLQAVLWMYENGLRWTRKTMWRDKDGAALTRCVVLDNCPPGKEGKVCSACLLGAIYLVNVNKPGISWDTEKFLESRFRTFTSTWNDRAERTFQEVKLALQEAIKDA